MCLDTLFFCSMVRRRRISTRTDPLVPYPHLFRSPNLATRKGPRPPRTRQGGGRFPPAYCSIARRRATSARVTAAATLALSDSTSEIIRSEEHTSELQSLMRTSYADFCLNKKKQNISLFTNINNTYSSVLC